MYNILAKKDNIEKKLNPFSFYILLSIVNWFISDKPPAMCP